MLTQGDIIDQNLDAAARVISRASAVLLTAGSGMGVDSGLPDFRGLKGFWRAYPAYEKLGLRFEELATPDTFHSTPDLAWGFYGHRLELYRNTPPHEGFRIIHEWLSRMPHGYFVFTSNADGHFQAAGFDADKVLECHGSVHWLQCARQCGQKIFPADGVHVSVNHDTCRAVAPLPSCPSCGGLARPNILLFSDWEWDDSRTQAQYSRMTAWMRDLRRQDDVRMVVIECGAGTAIPTVRHFSESNAMAPGSLIRINTDQAAVPQGQIGLPMGALDAIRKLDELLR